MSLPGLKDWLTTPQGQYVMAWEQAKFDLYTANLFGFHAVQIGIPEHDFLRANRIGHRVCCGWRGDVDVVLQPEELPFASASIDVVLLPHVLEFAQSPHEVLREVERVLRPEGSVLIAGFNPYSLWGLRRMLAGRDAGFPWQGQYLSVRRLKDWLNLLGMDTQVGAFGAYAPPCRQARWLARWQFMEPAGDRWWPYFGGVYLLQAIKRVRGMRLITPRWDARRVAARMLRPVSRQGGAGSALSHDSTSSAGALWSPRDPS